MSPEMELIDEIDYVEMGSMLARKIQQLMTLDVYKRQTSVNPFYKG